MTFLLDPSPQPSSEPFRGSIEALNIGVAGVLAKLEEQVREMSGGQLLVVVTGHPGAGKSTLVRALQALTLPDQIGTFHVDDYIDWVKLTAYVDRQSGLSQADYVPIANETALFLAKEKLDRRVIVFDGSGLIEDYARLCKKAGFVKPLFVLLDADPSVITARLAARGDDFHVSEKERQEHLKNLADLGSFNGILLSTNTMQIDQPIEQLSVLLAAVSSALHARSA